MTIRNVPLAERRAELASIREDIRTWFAPGPDQGELPLWPA